jgi:hypothetical protein
MKSIYPVTSGASQFQANQSEADFFLIANRIPTPDCYRFFKDVKIDTMFYT